MELYRPRSSRQSTDSRRSLLIKQQAFDFSDSPDDTQHKRSSSVDRQNRSDSERETPINFKPIKLAWPEDSSAPVNDFCNLPTDDDDEYETKVKSPEDSIKRKSIDIFLARNFLQPADILPSTKLTFRKCTVKDDDEEDCQSIDEPLRNEKKVTFAADATPKKQDAESRRLSFRSSYSKRYTTNFSFSSSRLLEKPNSTSRVAEMRHVFRRGNSLTLPESTEEHGCVSPCVKQTLPVAQNDKLKQIAVKRKLKSCRSRSFHRSFDNSSVIENFEAFPTPKPVKCNQNADVVTMVSLIVSNEEKKLESMGLENESGNADNGAVPKTVREKMEIGGAKEKHTKSGGILKGKWQLESSTKRIIIQPAQKKRHMNAAVSESSKLSENPTRSISGDKVAEDSTSCTTPLPWSPTTSETLSRQTSDTGAHQDTLDGNSSCSEDVSKFVSFQTAKEKECWTSFRKMTNKGFSVSLDTILRGLLTPTEYRLRKNELLTQE